MNIVLSSPPAIVEEQLWVIALPHPPKILEHSESLSIVFVLPFSSVGLIDPVEAPSSNTPPPPTVSIMH